MQHFSRTDEQPSTSLNRCLESAEAGPPPAAGLASSHPQSPPVSAEQSPSPPTVQSPCCCLTMAMQCGIAWMVWWCPTCGSPPPSSSWSCWVSCISAMFDGAVHLHSEHCQTLLTCLHMTDSAIIGFLCLWQQMLLTTVACVQSTGNYWTR